MNKKMNRKYGIFSGAVAIALLLVSTVTAVPQVQSKTVIDQIEEKELVESELVKMYNMLIDDGVININSKEEFYLGSTDELEKLYDEEGFLNHIVSDQVIQLLNEYYITVVSDNSFQDIFNSDSAQQLIQSDEFIDFMNSDEVQYVMDNFNPNSQNLLEGQQVVDYILEFDVYEQYISSCSMGENVITIENNEAVINSLSETFSIDAETCDGPLVVLLMAIVAVILLLLIGFVTWIPAIIVAILAYPVGWLCAWGSFMQIANEAYGYAFPILSLAIATFCVLIAGMFILGALAVWPLTCIIILIAAASQNNPFPQFP